MSQTALTQNLVKNARFLSLRFFYLQWGLFLLLFLSVTAAASIGANKTSLWDVIHFLLYCFWSNDVCVLDTVSQKIILEIRLPRVLMALITGGGLSICGAILQSVTRNPLADPYLFGISSGASLGAVIVIAVVTSAAITMTLGALIGAALAVLLMLTLAGNAAVNVEKLLLSGVAVSFMLSALTSLILYYSTPETAATLLFWMMGSFSNSQWSQLILPAITLLASMSIFLIFQRWISAIQTGDESAHTLGIPVNRLRLGLLMVCAFLTAVLVANVGGIGFVGLMIPHIARFIVGAQIQHILPSALMLGAIFMVWVDVLARSLLDDQVLPIGIVTSVLGSLFFFVILKRRTRIDYE